LLRDQAAANGFFLDGMPMRFVGSNLLPHGMIISKHTKASAQDLAQTVKKGKVLIVVVDAGILWNDSRSMNAGHAVVITGAELSRSDGSVLGYYINDSGTKPPHRGWFYPIEHFLKAWRAKSSHFIEVQ
jgi:hypothetical protein